VPKGEVLYVRIPHDLMLELDNLAEENDTTRSAITVILLSAAIGHIKKGRLQNASLITTV
jgi:predicted transcriptional regulator